VLGSRSSAQSELNVLDASSLRGRPMDTVDGRRGRDVGGINDEIPNLAEEDIGRNPVKILRIVRVSVN
jgi:hypothetical protein